MSLVFWAGLARAGSLEAGFHDPPGFCPAAHVVALDEWESSREGITADLEAMKRVGDRGGSGSLMRIAAFRPGR